MKHMILTAAAPFIALAAQANAQSLPSDPWAAANTAQQPVYYQQPQQPVYYQQPQQPVYYQQQQPIQVQQVGPVIRGSQPYQPTYAGGADNIWNTKMPEFTGEMTTWGTDYGQRANAPEVNMHNMLSITQHLRRMGYKIPTSFESRIKEAPEAVRDRVMKAMRDMEKAKDPFSRSAQFARETIENETGMTFENIIGNSLDLLSAK